MSDAKKLVEKFLEPFASTPGRLKGRLAARIESSSSAGVYLTPIFRSEAGEAMFEMPTIFVAAGETAVFAGVEAEVDYEIT